MLHITISASVASALYGNSRLLSNIHRLSESLPICWVRSIEERDYVVVGEVKKNEMRRFDIVSHIGNDPRKVVTVRVQVEKIFRIDDAETWIPIEATLFTTTDGYLVAMYFCEFDWKTGAMTLHPRGQYPYSYITA